MIQSVRKCFCYYSKLYEDQIITKRRKLDVECNCKNTLNFNEYEDHTRARILRAFLERLSYEDGK